MIHKVKLLYFFLLLLLSLVLQKSFAQNTDVTGEFQIYIDGKNVKPELCENRSGNDSYLSLTLFGKKNIEIISTDSLRISALHNVSYQCDGNSVRFVADKSNKIIVSKPHKREKLYLIFNNPSNDMPFRSEDQCFEIVPIKKYSHTKKTVTAQIQAVIDRTATRREGGIVVIPPGRYRTGTIFMRSGVHLYLDEGAILEASGNPSDYPMDAGKSENGVSSELIHTRLILFDNVKGSSIYGKGEIDGGRTGNQTSVKGILPNLIRIRNSEYIRIEGVTLKRANGWSTHILYSHFVTVDNVTSFGNGSDGIDIDSSQDVTVSNSLFSSYDDAFVIKSTAQRYGSPRNVDRILAKNILLWTVKSGLKIGTETHAEYMQGMAFENINIAGSGRALVIYLKDGSTVQNINYKNIEIENSSVLVDWAIEARGGQGCIKDICLTNIKADKRKKMSLQGLNKDHQINNIFIDNFVCGNNPVVNIDPKLDNINDYVGNISFKNTFRPYNISGKIGIRGWNILSDNYDHAVKTIGTAKKYNINHLQLSHNLIMDLKEIKAPDKQTLINNLINKAHHEGISEVTIWDHALYSLDYYPDQFKINGINKLDLDNKEFWDWFRNDYRNMIKQIPHVDGIILTFIETGARAERQHSEKMKTGAEKLAKVIDEVASVICSEFGKKLYIRTFAYTDAEYENTIGCLEHVKSKDIILMMKETPHDFFLSHPNDKYAGKIARPTIIEFDTGNEFNGQGIITNTWPEYIIKRYSDYIQRGHIVGYVARTDRYGTTSIVGTPNEILLYALKRCTDHPDIDAETVLNDFIEHQYGANALPYLKPAFQAAFDIVTSSLYTLGLNIANHSNLNFDPYPSSYGRHVSGKWLQPPLVEIRHGVNHTFHYWTDVVEHLSPARFKRPDFALSIEAPFVISNCWVSDTEQMDETWLKYVLTEKTYSVRLAEKAMQWVEASKPFVTEEEYEQIYGLFERTLIMAKLYKAVAVSYFGYRVYARDENFRTPWVKSVVKNSLGDLLSVIHNIEQYDKDIPSGQWDFHNDAVTAREYYDKITRTGWNEFGNIIFKN